MGGYELVTLGVIALVLLGIGVVALAFSMKVGFIALLVALFVAAASF